MLSNHTLNNKLLMLFMFMSFTFPAYSQGDDPFAGYKIKHLANFASYTTWPNSTRTTFKIGVVESQVYYELIKAFYTGKQINEKVIEIVLYAQIESDIACDLLYIPASFKLTNLLLEHTRGKPILIVGDQQKAEGILINFSLLNGEIIYEINPNAYNKANLQVDYYFQKTSRIFRE